MGQGMEKQLRHTGLAQTQEYLRITDIVVHSQIPDTK